jgi:hypothetical protein
MRGFNFVLRVAFFWSADYGYSWFDLGCTFVGLWGTSSKIEGCWKSSSPGAMTFFSANWRSSLLLFLLWFDWQNNLIWQFSIQKIVLCLDTKIISTEKFSVLIEIFFSSSLIVFMVWFLFYFGWDSLFLMVAHGCWLVLSDLKCPFPCYRVISEFFLGWLKPYFSIEQIYLDAGCSYTSITKIFI